MTPEAYRAHIATLGFRSLIEAGRWFGVNDRTARDWGQQGPPAAVAKFILAMVAMDIRPDEVDRAIRGWEART